jgi:hypothetical protein
MKTNLINARITNSKSAPRGPVLSPAALATHGRIARGYMRLLRAILFETSDQGSPWSLGCNSHTKKGKQSNEKTL